jgi:SAM-dependent methyltransferase
VTSSNQDQKARWNGPAGQGWVRQQPVMDAMYRPLLDLLVDGLPSTVSHLLDVGCGTGATTVAAAERRGADCVGIDVSEPMLTAAGRRAARAGVGATFHVADAQDYAFEPGTFDVIVSRFGVMFFDDPVAAFTNLRRAATDDATLRLIVWRTAEENPFMTKPEHALAALVDLPPRPADGPGPFAFADPAKVREVLAAAGWGDLQAEPVDVVCTLPEAELEGYYTSVGAVASVLRELEEPARSRVAKQVRPVFDEFVAGGLVRFPARVWLLTATAKAIA